MTYLWSNIDSYLKSELLADLGPSSSTYSTLKLAEVTVGPLIDRSHATTPSLLIVSFEAFPTFGSHGAGTVLTDSRYPYLLIVFDKLQDATTDGPPAVDSYAILKANMQEHQRRLVAWLAAHWGLPGVAASSDGERISNMNIPSEGASIELEGPADGGYFWGLAAVPFSVETEQ